MYDRNSTQLYRITDCEMRTPFVLKERLIESVLVESCGGTSKRVGWGDIGWDIAVDGWS